MLFRSKCDSGQDSVLRSVKMDYQVLFNLAVAVAGFFGGWTLNNITKTLERLDADVRDFHREFVDKDDYHRDIDELKDICKQIFQKLDSKADK